MQPSHNVWLLTMRNLLGQKLLQVIFAKKPPSLESSIFRYLISGLSFLLGALLLGKSLQTQQYHYAWLLVPLVDGLIYWPPLRFSWLVQVVGGILFFSTFGFSN
jgi:hypothetical protein